MTPTTPETESAPPCCSRRTLLASAGLAGAGAVALTGCGAAQDIAGGAISSATAAASGAIRDAISKAAIPVGGGKVFGDQQVVVTQPTAGQFKAFTSICTHMGCPVAEVADGTINCHCHGSRFDIATGEVKQGPATRPLPGQDAS